MSLLMWPSMIVLTTFLGIYLYKAYQTEQENLKKEVGYLFVNAVNTLEGGLINHLILKGDTLRKRINIRRNLSSDSLKVMVIGTHDNTNIEFNATTMHTPGPSRTAARMSPPDNVIFHRRIKEEKRTLQQTEGMISLIFQSEVDSTMGDTALGRWTISTNLTDSLKDKFDDNLKKAGLKITYTLRQYQDNSEGMGNSIDRPYQDQTVAGTYHDLASGEKYDVQLQSYQGLIFKKLLPEFVLAFLLLGCLGLAFYSMATTIRKEKDLLDAKSDFIQNMTHELKTPISTVRVALEALHQFDGFNDIKKRDDYLRISQNELDRLSLLVDRVLSISQIDKSLPAAQKEMINLTELVLHIKDTLKLQAEKQNTKIHILPSESNINLYADRQWVSGIIYNLLDNAIKYSDKAEPIIDVVIHKKNNQIELQVSDNGPGIAKEQQYKIFEKFYRVPQGNVHTIKGHGLGLAFVRRIIREMGGKISIHSELGKGSSFNVILPT